MRTLKYLLTLIVFCCITVDAAIPDIKFRRLETRDGLSNSQVNYIFKDSKGFVWFCTASGLDRYDGFRFKTFYSRQKVENSLLDNNVDKISENADGTLLMHTSRGYCLFDPRTETFERNINRWTQKFGIKENANINNIYIDKDKNIWIIVYGKGCYFHNIKTGKTVLFNYGSNKKTSLPDGTITSVTEYKHSIIIIYDTGRIICLNGYGHKVLWQNDHLLNAFKYKQSYSIYTDKDNNYYICLNDNFLVYMQDKKRWYNSFSAMLKDYNIPAPSGKILVKYLAQDKHGSMWIATDHKGVIVMNIKKHELKQLVYDKNNSSSISDNTQQSIFIDNNSTVWVGTYKNGVAYYSDLIKRFKLLPLGDVTSMAQTKDGTIWCGTNDNGIIAYNPITGVTRNYGMNESKLLSNIIVCCYATHDGSVWFGTYNGGLSHYKNGTFTAYHNDGNPTGLKNNSVWSISEDKKGNIWLGTLGSGLQCLNPTTGKFSSYNIKSSNLASDYLSSLIICKNKDKLIIGHSVNFSIMDLDTHKITNFASTRSKEAFSSGFVNQIFVDSRGLIWNGTSSGMNVYDMRTDQLTILDMNSGLYGSEICSVTEDRNHDIWLSTDKGVSHIKVEKKDGKWEYIVYSYNDNDGLQSRQFNQRSILLANNGDIYIGGQDGVNVVSPSAFRLGRYPAKAIFSGLVLFDHPISVGEEFNGHVILKNALNIERKLTLNYDDNAFTIQLASTNCSLPENTKFMYKLEGFNDKWMTTAPSQSTATFTNLSPGTYTLLVKVVNGDGYVNKDISKLEIKVLPPYYRTIWAYITYILIISGCIFYTIRFVRHKQKVREKMIMIRKEADQKHEIDDMKLRFFTNVSHELRTPLTLIISPVVSMIKEEHDENKRKKLMMIHRNSERLLTLVNQLLDFRRSDVNKLQLHLLTGDIVNYVQSICNSFLLLAEKDVKLTFHSQLTSLRMSFDDDKIGKIINNLLSNAFKFTPDGGNVDVSMRIIQKEEDSNGQGNKLEIRVSDTGVGISDNDKKHIFDRFYQVESNRENEFGGSGIGLNLVKDFVSMHGGNVKVEDNPKGGSVFIVILPIRHDNSLKELNEDTPLIAFSNGNKQIQNVSSIKPINIEEKDKHKEYEVLIVDDSDDFLQFMKSELSDEYKVRTANNGIEALKKVEDKQPDIILSDVMMPEMNGIELCKKLKSNPDTERIPFVMLTARIAGEQKIEGLENGADDYITKPFNLDLLNLRISNLIKWHNEINTKGKLKPHIKEVQITSLDEKLIQKATDFVEQNLSNSDLSVEQLSSALNMSRVHLYKKLLSLTGNTPSEFIRFIRLRHAEQFLKKSQLSISEISYQVGFNNPRYFSKYFKEMYGIMPSQYKENNEKKDNTHNS